MSIGGSSSGRWREGREQVLMPRGRPRGCRTATARAVVEAVAAMQLAPHARLGAELPQVAQWTMARVHASGDDETAAQIAARAVACVTAAWAARGEGARARG